MTEQSKVYIYLVLVVPSFMHTGDKLLSTTAAVEFGTPTGKLVCFKVTFPISYIYIMPSKYRRLWDHGYLKSGNGHREEACSAPPCWCQPKRKVRSRNQRGVPIDAGWFRKQVSSNLKTRQKYGFGDVLYILNWDKNGRATFESGRASWRQRLPSISPWRLKHNGVWSRRINNFKRRSRARRNSVNEDLYCGSILPTGMYGRQPVSEGHANGW